MLRLVSRSLFLLIAASLFAQAAHAKKMSLAEIAALEWKIEQSTTALASNASAKARLKAVEELAAVTDHRVIAPLVRTLKEDPEAAVRSAAAAALAAVKTPEVKGALTLASTADPDAGVRAAAKKALAGMPRRLDVASLPLQPRAVKAPRKVDGAAIKAMLASPSGDARLWAVKRAATVSFGGREELFKKHLLGDPSSRVRMRCAELLAAVAGKRALKILIQAGADGDPGVRFAVARALASFDDPGALAALQKLAADDENATVRAESKDLLEPSTRAGRRLLKQRIAALRSANPVERIKALGELSKFTHWRAMVPMSCTLLSDKSAPVRAAAANALTNMHDVSVLTALRAAAITEPDAKQKAQVRALLQSLRRRVDALVKLLNHPDAGQRARAARALGQAAYPPGLDPLIAASKDKDPKVRRAAVRGLTQFDDPKAEKALRAATSDGDDKVRKIVDRHFKEQERLKSWRTFFKDTNRLAAKTADKNPVWRADAAIGLGIAGAEAAAMTVIHLLANDPDEQVRLAAAWALVLMANDSTEKALHKAASKDKSQRVRLAARKYLVIGKVSVDDLIAQLSDDSEDTRRDAAEALSLRTSGPVVYHLIRAAMCDASSEVRMRALRGLARTGNPLSRAVIKTSRTRDPDQHVRRVAAMMHVLAGGK